MSHGWSADGAAGKEACASKKGDGTSADCEGNECRASRENGNDHNQCDSAGAISSYCCHFCLISNGSYALEFRLECYVVDSGLECDVIGSGFQCDVVNSSIRNYVVGSRL
jgi:hypothetical protein